MGVLVAGGVSALAFAVALASWSFAPIYQAGSEDVCGDPAALSPAQTFSNQLRGLPGAGWGLFAVLALLSGMAAWAVWNGGASTFSLVTHIFVLNCLLFTAVFDYRIHLIPNFMVVIMLVFGAIMLGGVFLFDRAAFAASLLSAGGGLLVCFPIFYFLSALTKHGLGMGDVKLISAVAWLLGLAATLVSVLLGLILCALTATALMFTKRKSKTDHIPFGPFIFAGYILLLLLFRV